MNFNYYMSGRAAGKKRTIMAMIKKDYLMLACDYMTEDFLLDAWWEYLAVNKVWYSKNENKKYNLESLTSTHLFNIKNGVLLMCEDEDSIPPGAAHLISIIDFILMKKAKEETTETEGDLPF